MKLIPLLAFICLNAVCSAATLTFNTFDAPGDGQGSWTLSRPSSPSNLSFLTGYAIDGTAPFPYPIIEYRSHLSFSISGISAPIQSAVLRLSQLASYSNGNQFGGIVTLGLFDVATDATLLNSIGGVQPSIFEDVGSGISYGTSVISISFDSSRVLEIPLNQAAISAIQNGAVFSVGMAMLDGDGTQDHHLFANPGLLPNPFVHELRVQTVPEPNCLTLLTAALIFVPRRHSKRSRPSAESAVAP